MKNLSSSSFWPEAYHGLQGLWGLADPDMLLAVTAGTALAATLLVGWSRYFFDRPAKGPGGIRWVQNVWLELGGGFYGIMGLLTFLYLETRWVITSWQASSGLEEFITTQFWAYWFDLGINIFMAGFWPWAWLEQFQLGGTLLLAGVGYVAFWVGDRLSPANLYPRKTTDSDTGSGRQTPEGKQAQSKKVPGSA